MRKLKTLHIFESYLPGSQNWTFRMLNNLDDTEVYISALEYCNPQFITPKINLIALPDFVSSDIIMENNDSSRSFVANIITRLKRKAKLEKYILYIAEKAKELNINLIHCHFANVGWNFIKLKKLTGLPFLVSFYGFDYESLPYSFPVWKKRYEELFRKADLFICEGRFGASVLASKGCSQEKIKVIHLGVELKNIPFIKRQKKENELHLVQISNFYQKKGHVYSLNAFKEALKTCPEMTLTFVGSEQGGIKNEMQIAVEKNNLSDKVFFLDFIDFSRLYEFLNAYQVFIHPSCYADDRDCEGGAPVVILDAEATGMPVIATTHCDMPGEVLHGKTGLLTSEKDINALKESIIRFYKMSNDEYSNFAVGARHHMENNFDAIKNAGAQKELYAQIILPDTKKNKVLPNQLAKIFFTTISVTDHINMHVFQQAAFI